LYIFSDINSMKLSLEKIILIVMALVIIFLLFKDKNIGPLKSTPTTQNVIKDELRKNHPLETNSTQREIANVNPKSVEKVIKKEIEKYEINDTEELADLKKEVEAFKDLSELNTKSFEDDLKALEVFDKDLATEIRNELNLTPESLEDTPKEELEELELNFEDFNL